MKKVFASAVVGLAFGAVSAVSALDLSVGGGGFFASDFGGGFFGIAGKDNDGKKASMTVPWMGGGVHAFFDATYAEIGLGLAFGGGTPQETYDGETEKNDDVTISFTGLNISLLGKYPIALADAISFFPAAGIDYAVILSGQSKSGSRTSKLGEDGAPDAIDFSALWFKFGVGADFAITDAVFLRPEVLYGIRLANKYENDLVKDSDNDPALGHGLAVKVGVGYKF